MNFKKSFVIKFQRSELLEIEIKKMTQIQEERSKITFAFLDDFNRLDSLKGGTMRQIHFQVASIQNQKSRFLDKSTTFNPISGGLFEVLSPAGYLSSGTLKIQKLNFPKQIWS